MDLRGKGGSPVVAGTAGPERAAVGRTRPPGVEVPRTAVHLVQTPGVRRQALDWQRLLPVQPLVAFRVGKVAVVIHLLRSNIRAEAERRVRPGPAGVFPLRLGRQIGRTARDYRLQFPQKALDVMPAHLLHRAQLVAGEAAGIVAHHRLPKGLRAGRVGQPEAPADRHRMGRAFVVAALRLVFRRAHRERARFDPAQALRRAAMRGRHSETREHSETVAAHDGRSIPVTR